MAASNRLSTGIDRLDNMLGGGLIPGTLTVVLGATGVGKTQLGISFANHGQQQEGERGLIFDMTSRGDSQNQAAYAKRMCDWELTSRSSEERTEAHDVWDRDAIRRDYFHIFRRSGRRVTITDLEFDQWKEWKAELTKKLDQCIGFFYGNFVHGVRRCVIDGVEPTDKASDSFQMHVFDYIYHQILHKDFDWVARDLFRAQFRVNSDKVDQHPYNHEDVGCLLLHTSHEVMLEQLLERPIESGDILSNANTVILMGKVRDGIRMTRAMHVAKHRGSACDDAIVPFEINEAGIHIPE